MTVVASEKKRVENTHWGMEERKTVSAPHSLILENRNKLTASGVTDVDSYDEQTIVANTAQGQLMIRGEGLHMDRLNTESGELTVAGKISSMTYAENRAAGGFFSRLFR